ncbi:putative membrane protein (partial), partial [Erwinia amylovora ATCC 49946]
SQRILYLLYTLCAVVLLPLAPGFGMAVGRRVAGLPDFLCAEQPGVSGALTEARAAKVSTMVALAALFALFSALLSPGWPDFFAIPQLHTLGFVGAIVVLSGAMFFAVGHRLWPRRSNPVPMPPAWESGRMSDGEVK